MRKLINKFDNWYTAVLFITVFAIAIWAIGCLVLFSCQSFVPSKVLVVAAIILLIVLLFFMIWSFRTIWEVAKEGVK